MSDESLERTDADDEMLEEYDFSGGVRGKHARAFSRGYRVLIRKADGTTETRDYTLPEWVVVLDSDVRTYFRDSEAVNRALRGLIALIPR
jgi:hypothetical protein